MLALITGMSSPMFAISVTTIAVELSGKEYRAWIYSFTWMTVVIGQAIVHAIALITLNWFIFGWITILIGSISYLFIPWIPESPRWLLSVGIDEVVKILRTVAQWNGSGHQDEELREMLCYIVQHKQEGESSEEKSIFKLFSKKRIAIHTLLITFTWIMNSLAFHGHRYLNLLLVSFMEVPGGLFGGILSDKFGRRWIQVLFFLVTGVASAVAAYGSLYVGGTDYTSGYAVLVVAASNVAKFTATMSFLVIYLQAAEIFPTPFRTTGSGIASTISNITVILEPFIVYTGKSSKAMPWIVSTIMTFFGMVSASFIPETMNYNLPETLDEANNFGKDRNFWNFRLPKENNKRQTTINSQ